MTKELFETAVKDGNPVCYYLFRDLGIVKTVSILWKLVLI